MLDGHGKEHGRLAAQVGAAALRSHLTAEHLRLAEDSERVLAEAFASAHAAIRDAILRADTTNVREGADGNVLQWLLPEDDDEEARWDAAAGGTTATLAVLIAPPGGAARLVVAAVGDSAATSSRAAPTAASRRRRCLRSTRRQTRASTSADGGGPARQGADVAVRLSRRPRMASARSRPSLTAMAAPTSRRRRRQMISRCGSRMRAATAAP